MSRRIAVASVWLLLLMQSLPVLACLALPGQALASCCCTTDRHCPMGNSASTCADPGACCVDAVGATAALSGPAVHAEDRVSRHPAAHGVAPAFEPLTFIETQASLSAAYLIHHRSLPLPAVPLYLRHLRLTL